MNDVNQQYCKVCICTLRPNGKSLGSNCCIKQKASILKMRCLWLTSCHSRSSKDARCIEIYQMDIDYFFYPRKAEMIKSVFVFLVLYLKLFFQGQRQLSLIVHLSRNITYLCAAILTDSLKSKKYVPI